jgi:MFS family permease
VSDRAAATTSAVAGGTASGSDLAVGTSSAWSDARFARRAVAAVFIANGLLFASWTAHIPAVQRSLGLSDGSLGIALLGAPVGSVLAMLILAPLLPRYGSKLLVQITLVGYCAAGCLVGVAGSLPAIFGALLAWGAFQGALDVAMNTQAIAVERAGRRPLMSGLHGTWSIGAFAGAGIGALAVGASIGLTPQLLVLGAVVLASTFMLTRSLLRDEVTEPEAAASCPEPAAGRRWSGAVLLLGAIAFASMLCEGAAADWASVYLSGPLHSGGAIRGVAYVTFSLAMVLVRLGGNRLLARRPPDRLLPALAAVATVGFGAALAIGQPAAAFVGFFCLGLGLALVVPTVFSAAGRLPGLHPGTAVATVSAFGWAGFVTGPPLIGRLAGVTSLPGALALLPVLTFLITLATLLAGRALHDRADAPEK